MTPPDDVDSPSKPLFKHTSRAVKSVLLPPIEVDNAIDSVLVTDFFQLPESCHLTSDVQSIWRMYDPGALPLNISLHTDSLVIFSL